MVMAHPLGLVRDAARVNIQATPLHDNCGDPGAKRTTING